MDVIYNNSINTNILNNNSNDITSVSNKQIVMQSSTDSSANTTNKTDSIEISEKDASKINKKKASDALDDTTTQLTDSDEGKVKLKIEFFTICQMMKDQGYNVPSFNLDDNTNSNGFLPFLDKMKDFVKNNDIMHNGVPMDKSEFYDFCDLYKEKLAQCDCK